MQRTLLAMVLAAAVACGHRPLRHNRPNPGSSERSPIRTAACSQASPSRSRRTRRVPCAPSSPTSKVATRLRTLRRAPTCRHRTERFRTQYSGSLRRGGRNQASGRRPGRRRRSPKPSRSRRSICSRYLLGPHRGERFAGRDREPACERPKLREPHDACDRRHHRTAMAAGRACGSTASRTSRTT